MKNFDTLRDGFTDRLKKKHVVVVESKLIEDREDMATYFQGLVCVYKYFSVKLDTTKPLTKRDAKKLSKEFAAMMLNAIGEK